MLNIKMKAVTAQGFGGDEYYEETYTMKRVSQERLNWMRQQFAIKYNVMIDMVEVTTQTID